MDLIAILIVLLGIGSLIWWRAKGAEAGNLRVIANQLRAAGTDAPAVKIGTGEKIGIFVAPFLANRKSVEMMREHMHRLEAAGLPGVEEIKVFSDVRRRNWKHFLTHPGVQPDAHCEGCGEDMHVDKNIDAMDKDPVLIYFCEKCLITRRVRSKEASP